MHITDIEIEEFGKLSDFTLTPGRGITLIEGENESGKSTLLAFIRFMLYGFPRKGAAQDGDEREKRLSWRSRRSSGCLTVEHEGATYRIFRKCVARGSTTRESTLDELSVLRLPQGEELDLGGKTPGEYFLGLPVELYEGSLCLSQLNADRVCANGMGEAVGDLLFSGDSSFSAEEAEAKLQNARRDLQHLKGRGGRIAELEDALAALDEALSHAKEDGARLSELRADLKRYRDQIDARREALQAVTGALERADIERTLGLFEDCAKARAEADRCRATVEGVGRQAAEELPDREAVSRMTLALRDLTVARERVELLVPEADRLSMARYDEKLLNGAKKTEDMGGAEAVISAVDKSGRRVKRRRGWAILFLLLALCGAVVAYLMPALRTYLAVAVAAIGACDLVAWIAVLRACRRRKKLFGVLGAPRNAMLRTYLEQCKREAQAYALYEEQLTANETALQSARLAQSNAMDRLRAELQAAGKEEFCDAPEQVAVYLETMNRRRNELQAALSEATVAFERARSVADTLSTRLQGEDEQVLRERLARIPNTEEEPDALKKQKSFLEQSIAGLERKRAEVERAESALSATSRDPILLERERICVTEELAAARHRLAALQLALEALEQASHDLRQGVTPGLRQDAAALFATLTDGAHGELHLGADFSMTVMADGVPRPIRHFSVGCRDAAYLSLRLALLATVSGTKPPLLLDEAFAHMDDGRAENLLNVLQKYCKEGGQCLLLTCHQREGQLLSGDATVKRFVMPSGS